MVGFTSQIVRSIMLSVLMNLIHGTFCSVRRTGGYTNNYKKQPLQGERQASLAERSNIRLVVQFVLSPEI